MKASSIYLERLNIEESKLFKAEGQFLNFVFF